MTKIDEILREALKMYKPTPSEEEILKRVSEKIVREAILESSRYEGILDVTLEGSAAKETWVRGREEVDIFIHFDPTVALETLEKTVIELGFKVLRKLDGNPRLMYADHPYVEGRLGNVIVNIVACYKVNPPNWISATDRTPYHTKYVKEKLDQNARDEVRLLKAFMMCCGVYGAEIKMRGFSGYLAELLIINYGGFMETLREASNWIPPVIIDIEKHYKSKEEVLDVFGERHLIVVDPVDRMRNVASAVSEEKFSEFILASKLFSRSPSISFFKPREEIISKTSTIRGNGERCILIV
ncbi:MAG: CCA tRNA nucleotidyltransferase, partial [Nitrososphaerota archaeon]